MKASELKATELRMGNIVYSSLYGKPLQIVHNSQIDTLWQGEALSEAWLLKFGFTKNLLDEETESEGHYYTLRLSDDKYCDLSFISGDKNGFCEVCLFPYNDNFRWKHVHQIQNAYFILTGEELQLTQNKPV